jgi:hypothetical protein
VFVALLLASASVSALIRTNAIVAANIAAGAVTADKIAAGAVTADKISVTDLAAVSAEIGSCSLDASQMVCGATTLNSNGIVIATGTDIINRLRWANDSNIHSGSGGSLSLVAASDAGVNFTWPSGSAQLGSGGFIPSNGENLGASGSSTRWGTVFSDDVNTGGILASDLAGSGNDFVCVDANGILFRSNSAC